ncbi:MAG: formate C-acetyltransferase [Flavobacteriales bacterium]|jgi:formate C-acetyltransferase
MKVDLVEGGVASSVTNGVAKDVSPWQGFTAGLWQQNIDVRNFIQLNYTPYSGDHEFL